MLYMLLKLCMQCMLRMLRMLRMLCMLSEHFMAQATQLRDKPYATTILRRSILYVEPGLAFTQRFLPP